MLLALCGVSHYGVAFLPDFGLLLAIELQCVLPLPELLLPDPLLLLS